MKLRIFRSSRIQTNRKSEEKIADLPEQKVERENRGERKRDERDEELCREDPPGGKREGVLGLA